jgi:poly-gamma-glutamate synthesis protein (capsule biosynthesis protein)
VYQGKLILHGCGDLLNDYEGIGGYKYFRSDLSLMYLAVADPLTGKLRQLQMVPRQMKNFKLNRVSRSDLLWLKDTLNKEGGKLGTRVELSQEGILRLQWD